MRAGHKYKHTPTLYRTLLYSGEDKKQQQKRAPSEQILKIAATFGGGQKHAVSKQTLKIADNYFFCGGLGGGGGVGGIKSHTIKTSIEDRSQMCFLLLLFCFVFGVFFWGGKITHHQNKHWRTQSNSGDDKKHKKHHQNKNIENRSQIRGRTKQNLTVRTNTEYGNRKQKSYTVGKHATKRATESPRNNKTPHLLLF